MRCDLCGERMDSFEPDRDTQLCRSCCEKVYSEQQKDETVQVHYAGVPQQSKLVTDALQLRCPSCGIVCRITQHVCYACGTELDTYERFNIDKEEQIPISIGGQLVFICLFALYSVLFYGIYFLAGAAGMFGILIYPLIIINYIGVGYISYRVSKRYNNISVSSIIGFSIPIFSICIWQKFHFIPVISLFLTVLSSLIGSAKGKK